MQLVRSEPLSEDSLSLVATDSWDGGALDLGYNLICLWNQVSTVSSRAVMLNRLHEARKGIRIAWRQSKY